MDQNRTPRTGVGTASTTRERRRPVQSFDLFIGAVFSLVGLLGFVPGITANHGELTFAGPHSGALLFGAAGIAGTLHERSKGRYPERVPG